MSRQTTLYLVAFAVILGGGLLVAHFTRATEPIEIQPTFFSGESRNNNPSLTSQTTKDRLWKPLSLQKVLSIDGIQEAMDIKDDAEGNTFIFDWGDFRIKKYSKEGKLLATFGNGKGQNPGEFINPTGFALTKDGQVWVCDPKSRITVFNPNGEIIKTLSTRNPAMRIVHGNGQSFVIMTTPRAKYLWESYTDSGEFIKAFGEFIEDQDQNAISLMGWIADDGSDNFYYAGYYPGILASYTMGGEPRYLMQTIDPKPLPRIQITPKGVKKIEHHKAEVSALSMSIAGNAIYLITQAAPHNDNRKVVDVYNTQDGDYLFSSEAPESCDGIFFTFANVYTVAGNIVTKWQLQR